MQVKPLYSRVLVRRLESKRNQIQDDIIIPDMATEKPMEVKVVAVGGGRLGRTGRRVPPRVKVGDRVLIGQYAGQEMEIEEIDHLILKEDEILGIIA